MNKFLKTRKNNLNRFFFQKFQAQVSQAPGFRPMLSEEQFNEMMKQLIQPKSENTNNVELPALEVTS